MLYLPYFGYGFLPFLVEQRRKFQGLGPKTGGRNFNTCSENGQGLLLPPQYVNTCNRLRKPAAHLHQSLEFTLPQTGSWLTASTSIAREMGRVLGTSPIQDGGPSRRFG